MKTLKTAVLTLLFAITALAYGQCPNPSSPQVNDGMLEFDSGACGIGVGTVQQFTTTQAIHVSLVDVDIQNACAGALLNSQLTLSIPASVGHPNGQARRFNLQFNNPETTDNAQHQGWNVNMLLPVGTIIMISSNSFVPLGCQYEFRWRLQDSV